MQGPSGIIQIANRLNQDTKGQALIEAALFSMIVVMMLCMAADFAYVAYVGTSITSASRQASTYAAQGQQAVLGNALPAVNAACSVAANELNGWMNLSGSDWSAYAASGSINGSSWTNASACAGNSFAQPPAFNADPESAYFTSTSVSVNSALNLPVNFAFFGKKSLSLPKIVYGRTVYMRQLN
jgi:Flp pilus assembly protein TadG